MVRLRFALSQRLRKRGHQRAPHVRALPSELLSPALVSRENHLCVAVDFKGWEEGLDDAAKRLQIILASANADPPGDNLIVWPQFARHKTGIHQLIVQEGKCHRAPRSPQTSFCKTLHCLKRAGLDRGHNLSVAYYILPGRRYLGSGAQRI